MSHAYIRHNRTAVRAYIFGSPQTWEMAKKAFDAKEVEKHHFDENRYHLQAQIADAMIAFEIRDTVDNAVYGTSSSVYVYVPNVDRAYRLAISTGAVAVRSPENMPYHERQAGVKDKNGNIWWISTYTGDA